MTKQTLRMSQKYFKNNGGIDEVLNNMDKKAKYEEFVTYMLGILGKLDERNITWTQKRNKK